MNHTLIHKDWGSIIEFNSPYDFFKYDILYWRNFLYQRKMIIFKKMNFDISSYVTFCIHYGELWDHHEYVFNKEKTVKVTVNDKDYCISSFSNKVSVIGMKDMPWHADIANPRFKNQEFCIRTLWITDNPNPSNSGHTTWLNIEDTMSSLTQEQIEEINNTRVLQQSWLYPTTLVNEYDMIKTHPITKKNSLRLNWFNDHKTLNAYITGVKLHNVLQPDCDIIDKYIKYIETLDSSTYTHTWDTYDIAIYDNWSFVHKRSKLNFDDHLVRHFYRSNINHLSESDFKKYYNEQLT